MPKTNGFVDLRIGHGATGIGDESVWPSFTDIMTVIVMIFLMTLVVIMVRNFGLSSELLTNISAREAAMLANQGLTQEKTELESALQSSEAERSSLATSLARALERISSLSADRLELEADLETLLAARQALEQANVQLTADTEGLTQQKTELESALQSTEAERSSLTESLKQELARIASLAESQRRLQDELAQLIVVRDELEQAHFGALQQIAQLTADTESLAQQNVDLETALQSTDAERSSLAESLQQAHERIASLSESQLGLQDELAQLIAIRDELKQANIKLQQAHSGALQQVAQLTADTEDLAQQNTDLETALQGKEAERSLLETSLARALERISTLSTDQLALQADLETLLAARQALEQANVQLTANEQFLTGNIESLSDKLSDLKLQSETEITSLTTERATLEEQIHILSVQLEQVRRLLTRSDFENQLLAEEMAQVERINESAAERFNRLTEEILSLTDLIEQRGIEIAALKATASASAQQYQSLQEEYETLGKEFHKLIRPARSSAGRTVVEIWVAKVAENWTYKIKRPDDTESSQVTRSELDSTLQGLKDEFGKSLYTKIVVPDNSNLSFNEAWGITWEILRKYDYYYQ